MGLIQTSFLAQLVEHCTGVAEVIGFKSRSGLNFFSLFLHDLFSLLLK